MSIDPCPTCGHSQVRSQRMYMFEQHIINSFRDSSLIKRDSCILCVEKHIGKAKVLFGEILTITESNDTSKARINLELNHLEIIGNLQAAADEAQEWKVLYDTILASERSYRYEGIAPDWELLASLILDIKKSQVKI